MEDLVGRALRTGQNRRWRQVNRGRQRSSNKKWQDANPEAYKKALKSWSDRNRIGSESYAKARRTLREKEWRKMGLTRSEIMSRIRSVSKLEIAAAPLCRKLAGVPLRHQPKNILGHPDYASKKAMVAVFVDGCLWHGHSCKPFDVKTNVAFWRDKIAHNQARDAYVTLMLEAAGWTVLRIPECEVRAFLRRPQSERRVSG